jgi:hypothetical protein
LFFELHLQRFLFSLSLFGVLEAVFSLAATDHILGRSVSKGREGSLRQVACVKLGKVTIPVHDATRECLELTTALSIWYANSEALL